MSNLTVKQKIILGVIIGIMLIVIGAYGYISLHHEEDSDYIDIGNNGEAANIVEGNSEISNETNSEANQDVNGEAKIIVHITGAVQKKGILELTEGARIADAIDAANGVTKDADLDEVNLAYILEDGQKIYIPTKADKNKKEAKVYITSESGNNVITESKNTNKGGNTKVNINTATQSELEQLPGIGPSIAARIIEYRQQNGKFNKIEELQNVKGVGDAKFGNIKEYVVVK